MLENLELEIPSTESTTETPAEGAAPETVGSTEPTSDPGENESEQPTEG
jgi:hypothetical protein